MSIIFAKISIEFVTLIRALNLAKDYILYVLDELRASITHNSFDVWTRHLLTHLRAKVNKQHLYNQYAGVRIQQLMYVMVWRAVYAPTTVFLSFIIWNANQLVKISWFRIQISLSLCLRPGGDVRVDCAEKRKNISNHHHHDATWTIFCNLHFALQSSVQQRFKRGREVYYPLVSLLLADSSSHGTRLFAGQVLTAKDYLFITVT